MELRISGIINDSIVDGPGIRMTVFAQGCYRACPGCHNAQTQPFEGGTIKSVDDILAQAAENPLLDGLTFSGGEPFEQAEGFAQLAKKAKAIGHNIVVYSGYTYEELCKNIQNKPGWQELLQAADILVDGPFEISKKNILLKFRGSSNQRIIDMNMTRKKNELIEIL